MSDPNEFSLARLKHLARTDEDGAEKQVLSLHDRLFARVLAPPATWVALKLGFSADAVTFLSVATGVAGAFCFSIQQEWALIIAVALLQFSYLLDCVDGDVARARGTSSVDGYLRDTMRHYLINPLVFASLGFAVFHRHLASWVIALGLLAVFFSTRVVNDLADRVTLDALQKRLARGPSSNAKAAAMDVAQSESKSLLTHIRALFLPDLAVMNWLTLAVILYVAGVQIPDTNWILVDVVYLLLAFAQIALKSGGLVLLWWRGVDWRVEKMAQTIEEQQRGRC